MKKVIMKSLAVLLAVMTVFGLAACSTEEVQTGYIEETDKIPEVGGKIKFSYEGNTEIKQNAANAFINAFLKKYPGTEIERDFSYTTGAAANRIAAGDIGDVFYFAESSVYNYAVTHKALMDLKYYIEAFRIDTDDIYSGIFAAGMIDGNVYYVARDFNQMIMLYNKDRVKSAGVDQYVQDGWNWDTFLNVCTQVTDDDYYGADVNIWYDPVFVPLLSAETGRGTWYDTASGKINLTKDGTTAAIEDLIDAYSAGTINLGLGDRSAFSEKKPVFTQCVYLQAESNGLQYDNEFIDWDMIHLPLANNAANTAFGCGSSGVGVYNRTKNPNAAAAFALFFYTPEGQTEFNGQTGGSVPVLASLENADFWQHASDTENGWNTKNWKANVYKADDYAVIGQLQCILPPDVANVLEENWRTDMEAVLNGTMQLSDAMKHLEELANQKWASLKK